MVRMSASWDAVGTLIAQNDVLGGLYAPADAGANRINGRALLAASRLDSREDGKATHLEKSWR